MPSVLLTDYKVLVLAVDEKYVAENFQQAMANTGEIQRLWEKPAALSCRASGQSLLGGQP